MLFKTCVKYKPTGKYSIIESDYPTKAQFISDLRANGYAVNPLRIKESNLYNWIVENSNGEESEWKYINRIPEEHESVSEWIFEGLQKEHEKLMAKSAKHLEESRDSHQQFLKDFGLTEEEFQAQIKARKGL